MAYLRGNTVVDGNLFVEGSITYAGARPDIVDSTAVFKASNMGMVDGRHLECEDSSTGSLTDSSIREYQTQLATREGYDRQVDFYFDFNNYPVPHTNHENEVFGATDTRIAAVNINYPVDMLYVINRSLISHGGDILNSPDKIERWYYHINDPS